MDKKDLDKKIINILGIPIHNVDFQEAINLIDYFVDYKNPKQIITLNPENLMRTLKDQDLLTSLKNAELVTADGVGILCAGKLLGKKLKERVTGVDLVPDIVKLASQKKYRIFLFGTTKEVLQKVFSKYKKIYPELEINGLSPPFRLWSEEKNRRMISKINKFKTDILCVALNTGYSEKWVAKNLNSLNASVVISVGGALDIISGKLKRAPKIFRRIGLEWYWRLMLEPKRIKRQIALIKFMKLVLSEKLRTMIKK